MRSSLLRRCLVDVNSRIIYECALDAQTRFINYQKQSNETDMNTINLIVEGKNDIDLQPNSFYEINEYIMKLNKIYDTTIYHNYLILLWMLLDQEFQQKMLENETETIIELINNQMQKYFTNFLYGIQLNGQPITTETPISERAVGYLVCEIAKYFAML